MNSCNYRPIWHSYSDIDMPYFCNHSYIFERRFLPNFWQERIIVMIWLVRDNITDQLSFYLKSLA